MADHIEHAHVPEQEQRLDPLKHTLFRLDGHSFSKFVRKMDLTRPFDANFTLAMKATAVECFNYFPFKMGFVGSDEITFYLAPLTVTEIEKQGCLPFSGRIQKMVSLLAANVSIVFYREFSQLLQHDTQRLLLEEFAPHFDCRVWQVSTRAQVLENLSERCTFTLKNSRQMFAQHYYSHKQIHGLSSRDAVEKVLREKGFDYNTLVAADNRVGNVLIPVLKHHEKEITIAGVTQIVPYDRHVVECFNKSPTEILDLLVLE